ncbi:MAG: cation diffusion facilitator family transporter [Bacteroidota bacterium]|nr:cation diffusion facilitator family transporter [Bacteroidota bacterium]
MDRPMIDGEKTMMREKNRVALASVIAAVFLTGIKLGVGLWTNSLGILSEALHSGLDFFAAVLTFFAIRVAHRPPDHQHQFGHEKAENISAFLETLLLIVTSGWILLEAYKRMVTGHAEVDVNFWSFAVIGTSIVVDFTRGRALSRVARKYQSQALEADALHFHTDILSSLVVIAGLISTLAGFPIGDPIAATIVAVIVLWISVRLGIRSVNVLLDRVPDNTQDRITRAILSVHGVAGLRSLRIRQGGGRIFLDAVIAIRRLETFERAHRIMDEVEESIHGAFPRADVVLHAEPAEGREESTRDAVQWLVQQAGLSAHNVVILRVNGALHIALDIEFPRSTGFRSAYERAADIEGTIRREIPDIADVHIHLEEEAPEIIEAVNVTAEETLLLENVRRYVQGVSAVRECNDLACYRTPRGLKITLSCAIDGTFALKESHDVVNAIERGISALDQRIIQVFVSSQPA